MDKKQRHGSFSVSSCLADPSPYPLHHTSRRRSESLKNLPNCTPEFPRPASLVRVKGQELAMQTPPPTKKSEMVWANDQSPTKSPSKRTPGRPGTPGTPGTPRRAGTPEAGSALVNPSSALLQDLLKEQRACRGVRASTEEMDAQVPRTPDRPFARSRSQSQSQSQSQDDTSDKQKRVNSALSAGLRQPREMGVREMDQYVSKMNKQNFDLKLEIFHRAQQVSALEKRMERMEELEQEVKRVGALEDELQELQHAEEDNQRLRESNEQLRRELDKRDQAVTEAVDLICQLEAKVAELEAANPSRPSTAPSEGPDVATPKQPTFDIPERPTSKRVTKLDQHRSGSPERPHLQSAPSFLRDENRTPTLRGLYIPSGNQSQSAMSVITKSESLNSMNETAEPASPRLSALSECSDLIPEEVPVLEEGADQPEDASRGEESEAGSSDTFGRKFQVRSQERQREHINQWIRPVPGVYSNQNGSPRQKKRSNDSMDPRQRVRMDGLFGGSRLPPTPDTMSTAPRNNRSNGSIQAAKGRKQQLGRPRSFDELASRRSSDNSARTGSMGTNMSDASTRELQGIERHETPAIAPLDSISTKHRRHASCQESTTSWDGNNHHGENENKSKRHTVNLPSSSPQLTPQDWVEAANSTPEEKAGYHKPSKYYQNSVSMGARYPGKASLDVRRHSMDSAIRRSTTEPTLDPHALEFAPHPAVRPPAPAPEPARRRISFRPPFFSRFGNSRRLQQSATQDSRSSEEHAPAPVVPKARSSGLKSTTKLLEYRPVSSRAEIGPPLPTYADPAQRALIHSSTESNMMSNGTRPITSNSKEHKRRSSLSIIGWMKGATGKKSEPSSPITPTQSNSAVRSRRSSLRMTRDVLDPAKDMAANSSIQAFPGSPNPNPDEAGRRLRYIERRGRRGSLMR